MRRPLVILLVAPITFGGLAYAGSAIRTASQPRIALTVSPSAQTAVRGGAVSFSVDVRRSDDRVPRLTVARLPTGARATWRLPSGAVTRRRATTEEGAVLKLQIPTRTPLGTRRVIVRATAHGRTVRRSLRLTVVRPARRGFALRVSPARQTVASGGAARFRVRVARARGTRSARVRLRVLRVPRGERATFTHGSLVVSTSRAQASGTHRLVIAGSAWIRARRVRRYAVVTLALVTPRRFTIRGDLTTLLSPGADAPLDPILVNPGSLPLRVRTLRIRVRTETSQPGCRGDRDYAVSQYGGRFPLVLRPGRSRLSALVPDTSLWPRIAMRDLPSNQDACKGAVVRFDYSGLATR